MLNGQLFMKEPFRLAEAITGDVLAIAGLMFDLLLVGGIVAVTILKPEGGGRGSRNNPFRYSYQYLISVRSIPYQFTGYT
jgi:hypothetical protein